jgi:hypothetical protein
MAAHARTSESSANYLKSSRRSACYVLGCFQGTRYNWLACPGGRHHGGGMQASVKRTAALHAAQLFPASPDNAVHISEGKQHILAFSSYCYCSRTPVVADLLRGAVLKQALLAWQASANSRTQLAGCWRWANLRCAEPAFCFVNMTCTAYNRHMTVDEYSLV